TQQITTVVSGFVSPNGVAVDAAGNNLYISDATSSGDANGNIDKWNLAAQQMTVLATSLDDYYGVAVDVAGNVYFTDRSNGAINEWNASTQQVTTLIPSLNSP